MAKEMTTAKIRIDRKHSDRLLKGESVAIKVPHGATAIQLQLDPSVSVVYGKSRFESSNSFAEVIDTFLDRKSVV